LDNPNSQPSVGGPLSQTGLMTQVCCSGFNFPHLIYVYNVMPV